MLSNKAEIVTKIITEKLLHSPHSEVSTYSKAFPEEKGRYRAGNIQQHSLLPSRRESIGLPIRTPLLSQKKESKGKRLCLQGSRKIGCQATIKIKSYTYPEYTIGDVSGKSARQIKILQENQLELLRKAIAKGDDIRTISKYFVCLPSEAAHSGHPTGSSGGFAQRIHPLLSEKISQLVAAGITDTNEVRRSLRFYVTNTLCKELGYQAKQSDRALYPTTTDVRNHVYSAKRALELSKLDQENARLKIEQWQSTNADHRTFFDLLFCKKESQQ